MEDTAHAGSQLAAAARRGWIDGADPTEFYRLLFAQDAEKSWKDELGTTAAQLFDAPGDCPDDQTMSVASFERLLNMVTDVAWQARMEGIGIHEPERVERNVSSTGNRVGYLVCALIELQLYRFDFNYSGIFEVLSRADDDPLVVGPFDLNAIYYTFAQLSSGRKVTTRQIFNAVGVKDPENIALDLNRVPIKIRHLLLHGMWLFPFRYYGLEMLLLSQSLIQADPKDGNAYYRRGEAYRRIAASADWDVAGESGELEKEHLELNLTDGAHQLSDRDYCYRRAIESLDMAIRVVDPKDLARHDEYKNYRLLVSTEWQVQTAIRSAVEQQVAEVDEKVRVLSRQLETESNQLMWKSVEVLSLFAALMGLLITNISVVGIQGISTLERVLLIALMGVILVVFYLLVRNTVYRVRDEAGKHKEVPTRAEKIGVLRRRRTETERLKEEVAVLRTKLGTLETNGWKYAPLFPGREDLPAPAQRIGDVDALPEEDRRG